MYARMAQAAAWTAIENAKGGYYIRANAGADQARIWLEMAGAAAARDWFNLPPA